MRNEKVKRERIWMKIWPSAGNRNSWVEYLARFYYSIIAEINKRKIVSSVCVVLDNTQW